MDSVLGAGNNNILKRENLLLLPFFLLIISQPSFADQRDFQSYEFANRVNEAVKTLFPINVFKKFPKVRSSILTCSNSTKCCDQVELLVQEFINATPWALKMIDASSKIPSGILMGNRIDLGMYDECVAIHFLDEDNYLAHGRHCMYNVNAELEGIKLSEVLSICMPETCEPQDLQMILETLLEIGGENIGFEIPLGITGVDCSSIEPYEWTAGGIVTLVGFSLLLLFLTVSTISDVFLRIFERRNISKNGILDVLTQFSIYSNAVRILSTKTNSQTLPAIQGIRFFSMCWVVLGHEYFMTIYAAVINATDLLEWSTSWDSLYIMIAPFAVDTFFTVSGFLMSYLFLIEMSKGRSFNLFGYYFHRYLRLTPAYAALILSMIFIIPQMGSGAFWQSMINSMGNDCRSNWWPMLLYVHNYVNKEHLMCLGHSWYLAVEMQFFWISPVILYPLAKKPKIGLVIWALAFIAAIVTPAVIGYTNQYSSYIFGNGNVNLDVTADFYMPTHVRGAAWLVGIFFGYLVFSQKRTPSKRTKWIGWILTLGAFLFCIFSYRKFQDVGYKYEAVWETFYAAVARPIWAAGVAWIIYASVRGFAGPIGSFLSLSIFYPFSRISYCVYLVHFIIQMMKVGAARVPRHFSDFSVFNYFLSDFVLSIIVGFFFTLVFESPVLTLEKLIWKRKPVERRSANEVETGEVKKGIDNPGLIVES